MSSSRSSGLFHLFLTMILLTGWLESGAQTNRYWSQNFNEESSMLCGSVVGGGGGISSIYYNPAAISEIENSNLSINASLVSLELYNVKNAVGDGLNLTENSLRFVPRFISYMLKPKKIPRLSMEMVILNKEYYDVEFSQSVDQQIDILTNLPGNERYVSIFRYHNYFRNDWVGIGGSYNLSPRFTMGASIFLQIQSLRYEYMIDIEAYPPSDTIYVDDTPVPFYSAYAQNINLYKFNDYRFIWKLGMIYTTGQVSLGLNINTPSLQVYSDGKKVTRKVKQSNISNPEGTGFLPNILIEDQQSKDQLSTGRKDPLSIAFGITVHAADNRKTYFASIEYFSRIDPYKMISATVNPFITTEELFNNLEPKDWLSVPAGASSLVNLALGYRWEVRDDLLILTGFRTDFNFLMDYDYGDLSGYYQPADLNYNVYHLTGGGQLTIFGHNVIAGLQYSLGIRDNQTQLISFTDPVEWNEVENAPLQGNRNKNMKTIYNSFSLFFGATFNFGQGKKSDEGAGGY